VLQTDGAQLLSIPSWTDEDISTLITMRQTIVAQLELQHGDQAIARAIAIDAIESGQDNPIHHGILTCTAHTKQDLELAIKLNRLSFENTNADDEITAMARNNLAYAIFKHGDATLLDEADSHSLKAMEILPMHLAVRSTRGSVLVALGQHEAGLALLEDERFIIETKQNQASVLSVRARAYEALGRTEDAAEARKQAQQLDPDVSLFNESAEGTDKHLTKVF